MHTLTVELAATYLVGAGQWVVHNCKYLPAGDAGQYRLQTDTPTPYGVSGIYEYIDLTRNNLWYVGKADDLRVRSGTEMAEGRFKNWGDVIWTPINVPQIAKPNLQNGRYFLREYLPNADIAKWQRPAPIYQRMLLAAEKIRILQLEDQFGGREFIANGLESGDMNLDALVHWLSAGGSSKRPGWPEWLHIDSQ